MATNTLIVALEDITELFVKFNHDLLDLDFVLLVCDSVLVEVFLTDKELLLVTPFTGEGMEISVEEAPSLIRLVFQFERSIQLETGTEIRAENLLELVVDKGLVKLLLEIGKTFVVIAHILGNQLENKVSVPYVLFGHFSIPFL